MVHILKKLRNPRSLGLLIVGQVLKSFSHGAVTVFDHDKQKYLFEGQNEGPHPVVTIRDWSSVKDILRRGDIGTAEAYMNKKMDIEDIGEFIHWACLNEQALKKVIYGRSISLMKDKIRHFFNRNSKSGSKKNIQFHYDIGNDFYKLWLDRTKAYSAAYFQTGAENLEQAQVAKFDRIVKKINPQSGENVFEIGCGWGGFLERLMVNTDARYYGITLSREQYEFCQDLILKNNWQSRALVEIKDYRDVQQTFDHVVSVEMVEAVGYDYWPQYVSKIKTCLKSGGSGLIQGISIRYDLFKDYLQGTDFIQRYIFPGGVLINLPEFTDLMDKQGLKVQEVFSLRESYAKTLRIWAENLKQEKDQVFKLGFDERFFRMWLFYFGYCEGAFRAERIDVSQIYFK